MKTAASLAAVFVASLIVSSCAFSPKEVREVREPGTGTVTGQMMTKGGVPMSGGIVFFFNETSGPPPSSTRYWRVPTDAFRIDEKGKFTAVLAAGRYYMGASRKFSGELLGPPQEGDLFFISQDAKGSPKLHPVAMNETLDMGVISEAAPFSRAGYEKEGITSVEGVVRDGRGNPVEGMLVFAFSTPTMVGRPLFVSDRTGKDGSYLLRLYDGGAYYLRARLNYGGGPPSADEVMGVYKDGKPLTLGTGEARKGIDITVIRIGQDAQPRR